MISCTCLNTVNSLELICIEIMLVALSDMNITSRVDAYLTNITFPWEKKSESHATVGALFVYRVRIEEDEQWTFERLWSKSFPSQTSAMHWNQEVNLLCVGLDSGKIHLLTIPEKSHFMNFHEDGIVNGHKKRVMGLATDSGLGYVYSIGEDGRLKVADISSKEVIYGKTVGLIIRHSCCKQFEGNVSRHRA